MECRAAGHRAGRCALYISTDVAGAVRGGAAARSRLGYRTKSLVRPEHVRPRCADALTPTPLELEISARKESRGRRSRPRARAARSARWSDGLWIEVPTYLLRTRGAWCVRQ